jgi:hypothetical protein
VLTEEECCDPAADEFGLDSSVEEQKQKHHPSVIAATNPGFNLTERQTPSEVFRRVSWPAPINS